MSAIQNQAEIIPLTKIFITAVSQENVSVVVSRQLITDLCGHLKGMSSDIFKTVSHFTLEKLQSRAISFEEQVVAICKDLADLYEQEQNWREAAQVLVRIPLETGQKQYSAEFKLETYLKIARLYLEDEDSVQA